MSPKATTRTYEIVAREGTFRMDIADDWKVTYGPVAIGAGSKSRFGGGDEGSGSMALRIYETDKIQRAIFTGVKSFRDLSIPLKRLVVREKGTDKWTASRNSSKRSSTTVIERKWVTADEYDNIVTEFSADD